LKGIFGFINAFWKYNAGDVNRKKKVSSCTSIFFFLYPYILWNTEITLSQFLVIPKYEFWKQKSVYGIENLEGKKSFQFFGTYFFYFWIGRSKINKICSEKYIREIF